MQQPSAPTSNTLTVYSLPGCVQCNASYRSLDKKGLTYTKADAADGPNNELIVALGYMQAPVSILRDGAGVITDHWGGFRPDKIDEIEILVKAVAKESVSA